MPSDDSARPSDATSLAPLAPSGFLAAPAWHTFLLMAAVRTYFSAWRDESFACQCGWSGRADAMSMESRSELAEYACPKCAAHLILVSYPTEAEILEAAATGNEEARTMGTRVLDVERRRAEWACDALRDPSQLPELLGEVILFTWDLHDGRPGDNYYVITAGEQVVWRELAYYEDWERFHEVKAILKKKYGARFRSVTPTDAAKANLIGDSFKANLDPT